MSFFRGLWKSNSKHKKLCEEWALANSRECMEGESGGSSSGMSHEEIEDATEAKFSLKYLGSTLVETPSSEEATAEAIKTVITMAKASGKKLQRVSLAVSLRGIRMTDLATEEDQLQVSIYRISYCSADATHDHVFAFIATNLNETMECHAFLCPKRKTAQTVTLTVAQAFNTAYEAWQLSQSNPRIHHTQDKSPSLSDDDQIEEFDLKNGNTRKSDTKMKDRRSEKSSRNASNLNNGGQKNLLIDLSNEAHSTRGNSWVSFEEDSNTTSKKLQTNGISNSNSSSSCSSSNGNSTVVHPTNISTTAANSIPMTTLRTSSSSSTPSHHVVPRPSTGFKVQNAWGESRSVDLICS